MVSVISIERINGEKSLLRLPGKSSLFFSSDVRGLTDIPVAVSGLFPGHPKMFTQRGLNPDLFLDFRDMPYHWATLEMATIARGSDVAPHRIKDTMAFMFESCLMPRICPWALDSPSIDHDYYQCWIGLKSHFNNIENTSVQNGHTESEA
ncbi:homogentisate 1,2-dioxygenase [Tanacetum coccineum]